ncbi:IS66 family insertion sequence element accessory protein TnpA [Dysgonomonas reticulitermitis]
MRSKKWNIEVFEAIYNRYHESGLPPKAFCANEGIRLDRFYEWRVKLTIPKKRRFIPVKVGNQGQLRLPHRNNPAYSSPGTVRGGSYFIF